MGTKLKERREAWRKFDQARDEAENYPDNGTLRSLINEATIQEGKDWNAELLPLLDLS